MIIPAPAPDAAAPNAAAPHAAAWPVLVVCADAARVAALHRALHAWPVPVTLGVASSAMRAMQQSLMQPSRLVLVDWAIDGPGGQALVRQLARLRPALPVLAFDELRIDGPAEQVLAWPWNELDTVLDHWLMLAPGHGPLPDDKS